MKPIKPYLVLAQWVLAFLMVVVVSLGCTGMSKVDEHAGAEAPPAPTTPEDTTVKTLPGRVHFIAFGDNGSGIPAQYELADRMANLYAKDPFPFVLMLGDNIYEDGNIHKYAESRFLKPYHYLLDHQVKFYPVLGNHDVLLPTNAQAEIDFYRMPSAYYDYVAGPIHFFALNTNDLDNKQQLVWLQNKLANTTEPWKIVYGHHPMYSSGMHGNTGILLKSLKPLLEQNHVNLYLSGHDHDYERFSPVNGVHYVVSGGGGAYLRDFAKVQPGSLVRCKIHHFLSIEVQGDTLHGTVIDVNGKIIDQWTQTLAQAKKAA